MISLKKSLGKFSLISLGRPNYPLPKGQSKLFLLKEKVLTGYNRFISAILFFRKAEFLGSAVFTREFKCMCSFDCSESVITILHKPVTLEFA